MNTRFYKMMLQYKRDHSLSLRELAKVCGVSRGTIINLLNENIEFRPLTDITMGKIHNSIGIPYEVMEEYNKEIYKERGM